MEMLYEGRGGKDISELLSPFTLRSAHSSEVSVGPSRVTGEEPPAYDEVQPGSPRRSPTSSSAPRAAGKRQNSRENLAEPSPKKPSPSELTLLRAEVDQLTEKFRDPPTTPGSPMEDGYVLDRLDAIEKRLHALESQAAKNTAVQAMEQRLSTVEAELTNRSATSDEFRNRLLDSLAPRLLEDIRPHIDQRLDHCTHDWIAKYVEKDVNEQYDTAAESLATLRDELEESVREKMANAVHENLFNVVSEQLPEIHTSRYTLHVEA
ncbi:hypothetical protein SLS56_012126 [Neofusicoccum ribis]|uniref:Uncharacterized protein n=1 Tax=Neofusicoccum ribis TaxID=45134 RepID=A0ABR3S9P7_9PEZI